MHISGLFSEFTVQHGFLALVIDAADLLIRAIAASGLLRSRHRGVKTAAADGFGDPDNVAFALVQHLAKFGLRFQQSTRLALKIAG